MKKNIYTFFIVLGILIILSPFVFAGGQQDSAPEPEAVSEPDPSLEALKTIRVTDLLGREVTVTEPVEKIAFFHPGTADALLILDVWDMVVAKTGWTLDPDIFPGLNDIPSITPPLPMAYNDTDLELLIDLMPDLLILKKSPIPGMDELLAALEGIIPVVVVATSDYADMEESFEILGKLLGRETEAESFIDWSDRIIQPIRTEVEDLSEEDKTRVFFKFSYGTAADISTGTNELTGISMASKVAGAVNIAGNIQSPGGWVPAVDKEWLVEQDYDVLVIRDIVPDGFGHRISNSAIVDQHRAEVMALPVFKESKAVKNGRVYMVMDFFFGTPLSIVSFPYFAKAFYPELFADMNPEIYLQEYYRDFLRTDIDVSKGVFFYPEL